MANARDRRRARGTGNLSAVRPHLDLITIGRVSVDLYGQQIGSRLEDVATFAKAVGGCPANVAIGAARLGLRAALITRVGDEPMGRFVLEQLAREELGLDPQELGGNALAAGATSFALFSLGAIFPVAPFLVLQGVRGIVASIALSAVALTAIGLLTSLFNGRSPWFSAARQTLFGCAAAAITYGIGSLLGVSLS